MPLIPAAYGGLRQRQLDRDDRGSSTTPDPTGGTLC